MSADRASAYDAWYGTPLGEASHRIELALVESLVQPQAGERALDAGCGTGIYTAWLVEHGAEVTGLDIDPGPRSGGSRAGAGRRPGRRLASRRPASSGGSSAPPERRR